MTSVQGDGDGLVICAPNYRTMLSSEERQPTTSRPLAGNGEEPGQQDGENQPLLCNRTSQRAKPYFDVSPLVPKFLFAGLALVITLLILIVGLEYGYIYANDPANGIFDPKERDRIRKEWELEASTHRQVITQLLRERDTIRREWVLENDKLVDFLREVGLEHQKWEEEQETWDSKRYQWEKQRLEWHNEVQRWEEQRWEWTEEQHRWEEEQRERSRQRRQWEEEQREWDRQRRQWQEGRERREREEKERQRKLTQWGPLQRDQECVSYGTARYHARLQYVPPGWDQYTACTETSIRIHQEDLLPSQCQYNGNGQVVGVWVVSFEEPACKPWWRDIKDHGCTSRRSGIHRYEAHLEGYLEPKEYKANWAEMCNTTPHTMFGTTYGSPTECKYWPKIGVYGFWDIPDSRCQ